MNNKNIPLKDRVIVKVDEQVSGNDCRQWRSLVLEDGHMAPLTNPECINLLLRHFLDT